MMRKLIVAVGFLIVASGAIGEGEHAGRPGGAPGDSTAATSAGTPRPAGDNLLRDKELNLLVAAFPNLGATYLRTTFSESLPKALAKATGPEKDETDTSLAMAQLFTTIDKGQRDAIVKLVEAERAKEIGKETNRDQKYLDLLNRLFWAGKALQGTLVKDPEAQAFLKKFVGDKLDFKSGDFKAGQEQKAEILRQMQLAKGPGGKEAKEFLRKELNRDALMNFIDHSLKSGNPQLGKDLAEAISWNNNGQKFIDMIGPNNETQRLYLGTDGNSAAKAISAFSAAKGGLLQNQLAREAFNQPAKEWFVGSDGKLAAGRPAGVGAPAPSPAKDQKVGGSAPPPQTGGGNGAKPQETANFVNKSCTGCHAMTAVVVGNSVEIKKGGRSIPIRDALAAVETNAKGMVVPEAAKKEFRAFVQSL